MLKILPLFFDPKFGDNHDFSSSKIQEIIENTKSILKDTKFDLFYNKCSIVC